MCEVYKIASTQNNNHVDENKFEIALSINSIYIHQKRAEKH